MEWLYPIFSVIGLMLLGCLLLNFFDRLEGVGSAIIWIAIVCLLVILIFAPVSYYGYRDEALRAEAFYDMIQNNIAEEGEDYIVVSGLDAAMWQAGSVTEYNAYLTTTRYWDSIAFIGWFVYPVPDHLKEVRLIAE